MKRIIYVLSLSLTLVGCSSKKSDDVEPIFKSAEEYFKQINAHPHSESSFRLAVSDNFTINGKRDEIDAGIVLIVADLMNRGYLPEGDGKPVQKNGYRIVKFKKTQ